MTSKSSHDPVCGMKVPPDGAIVLVYGGVEHRFCSEACRQAFLKHPRAYLDVPKAK
jgi:YHS domain-containing protein